MENTIEVFIKDLNLVLEESGRSFTPVTNSKEDLYSLGLNSIELLLIVVGLERKLGVKFDPSLVSDLGKLTAGDLYLALGGGL